MLTCPGSAITRVSHILGVIRPHDPDAAVTWHGIEARPQLAAGDDAFHETEVHLADQPGMGVRQLAERAVPEQRAAITGTRFETLFFQHPQRVRPGDLRSALAGEPEHDGTRRLAAFVGLLDGGGEQATRE